MFFESHAHYNDKQFDIDRNQILDTLKSHNVSHVINIGTDVTSSKNSIELAKKYPYMYAAVGIHPNYVNKAKEEDIQSLELLCKEEKVVAIGEIGLDFYYEGFSKETQHKWFLSQLNLAKKLDMPVVIHSREASQDVFNKLSQVNLSNRNGKGAGVIHCYSGSLELAKEYIKLGYYIGISGVLTFKNAKKLIHVVENIPLESILLETDCPYLSPAPNRGERNDSTNLKYIASAIADIKNIPLETVAKVTNENGERLFFKK